jgi:hypothetical protein
MISRGYDYRIQSVAVRGYASANKKFRRWRTISSTRTSLEYYIMVVDGSKYSQKKASPPDEPNKPGGAYGDSVAKRGKELKWDGKYHWILLYWYRRFTAYS